MKPWYKKKRYWIPLGSLGFVFIVAAASGNNQQSTVSNIQTQSPSSAVKGAETTSKTVNPDAPVVNAASNPSSKPSAQSPAQQASAPQPQSQNSAQPPLSNNNYYQASSGDEVHSPAYPNSGVPAGATAQCGDGTYSFSENHRGTCSHHGGVAHWLN